MKRFREWVARWNVDICAEGKSFAKKITQCIDLLSS